MASANTVCTFSPTADHFAYVSPDGCLKIWETSSNILKQEYTPSSHLSSTCSSLAWGPSQQSSPFQGKKKAKKCKFSTAVGDLNLIAMGTLSGDVLLYSVAFGDLHMKLTGGHTDAVNGISWFSEEDSLFTCSSDQHIVKWSISQGSVITKWRASKSAIHAVCVVDSNSLLYGSSAIFWWDLKNETVLKKFIGHAAEVFCLMPIRVDENCAKYFISSATGDRVVNVWQLSKDSDSNAIASFTLSDDLATLDISQNCAKSQLVLSAVTKTGILNIFEHQLNGRVKKPLSPKFSIQIASMANKSEKKSQAIPFLGAKLCESHDSCMVAYGYFLKPTFERMKIDDFQKDTFLIRENHVSSTVELEGISKIKQPERPTNIKHLAPGYMTPSKPTESVPRKKKRKEESSYELPMEERLNAMYLGQAPDDDKVPDVAPNSDSMIHLLLQGLQSQDNKLLGTVFRCSDENLITNTVKRLPLNSIPSLLKVLYWKLTKREQRSRPCLRWLKGLLSVHLPYLMTLQEVDDYIGPMSQLLESHEETVPRMTRFMGFVDIIVSQIDYISDSSSHLQTEPLSVYEVESSSEEMEEEDEMDHSDVHSDAESHSDSASESGDDLLPLSGDEMENL